MGHTEKIFCFILFIYLFSGFSSHARVLGQDVGAGSLPAGHGRRAAAPPVPPSSRTSGVAGPPHEAVPELADVIHRAHGQKTRKQKERFKRVQRLKIYFLTETKFQLLKSLKS